MSVLRINYMTKFHYGDDVVLVTMDRHGLYELHAALLDAIEHGASRLDHDGVVHEFRIEPGAADIELQPIHVVWKLDQTRATEIVEDMKTPAEVLILSRDEYVDVIYPWQQPV